MELKTSEFFKNLKSLPSEGSDAFTQLVNWEVEKCLGGVNVNGIHIPGWLYWHLNHWWIFTNEPDKYGNIARVEQLPNLRDNEWIRSEAYEQCKLEKKGYMEIGARRGGKDLLNSSLLYTSTGEIPIGNCQVGQQIYDDSGSLTTITGKYPQGIKPVYKITLIDGRELYCGLDHNWYVWNRKNRKKKKSSPEYQVKTTAELLKKYKHFRNDQVKLGRKRCEEFFYGIPNAAPVEYPAKNLPIDPYLLGLWLGDGSSNYSKITSVDKEIIDCIYSSAKLMGLQVTVDDVDTFMITSGKAGGWWKTRKDQNTFHAFLRDGNLYNNKHIPDIYFYCSVDQRMELLRGLMDTDGSCDLTGSIEFSSSIPKLAEDFYKLCRSLGITVTRKERSTFYKKDGKRVYCKNSSRFVLFTELPVFKLSRKLAKMRCKSAWKDNVSIIDIQYVFDAETTCITVDNESHLFLTDNYTVTHNSEFVASVIGYNSTLFKGSENAVVGGNEPDLSILKQKVSFGIKKGWNGMMIPRLDKDWRKASVRLGFKSKDNEDEVWSSIVIRNVAEGQNTEGPAGITAKSFVIDESGKFAFGQTFAAAKPSFLSEWGWMCIPIITGTGGAFDKGEDAERFFYNPDGNNFLAFIHPETGEKTCLFMSGLYRYDCKDASNLADYLIQEGHLVPGDYPELSKIPMQVSNKMRALEKIEADRKTKALDPDQTEYRKEIMYFPLTPKECFLTVGDNFYNAGIAQEQRDRLEREFPGFRIGMYVDLEDTGDKIIHKPSTKLPISSFPVKPNEDKDAPIVILEHPIPDPPNSLYVVGVDPYRFDDGDFSTSIGVAVVFKRMYDVLSDTFQNMPVAWYAAKPKSLSEWNKNVKNLIEYFNATALCENDEMGFINYMIAEGKGYRLEDTPEWLREFIPTSSTVQRAKGISSANAKVKQLLRTNLKQYMEEVFITAPINGSDDTQKVLGVRRIYDHMFLEEIVKWNKDGNFDREIAYSLAITHAKKLDERNMKIEYHDEDPRFKIDTRKKKGKLIFKPVTRYQPARTKLQQLFK